MRFRWLMVVLVMGAMSAVASPRVLVPAVLTQPLVLAQVAGVPAQLSQLVLQMPDTLRVRVLAALARGDIAGAIALWELEMGRQAPLWLRALQNAFSTDNQRAGPCIEVAKAIFEGLKRLGAEPSFVRFTAHGSRFLGFEMRAGKPGSTIQVSERWMHVVVRVKDRLYDAFTGPAGLPVDEYMKRLVTEPGASITSQTVSSL
ncbi:hypothetical protein [Archangium violaceum]|uniref:hypothetical protein n=1 Tax=Archangium violaceum TaxID=83451 RepID=UPI000696833D|nr:hypothetical protein [Archangium violaceum]